ncbi:unnamed protein product [Dibothriocephalus latus]|uniref:Reverse transcriptase domain-containing protein n=1 Tax=Dibothriocephalus latus TaxID=60516 RepID=A0A3P7LEJ0_DIBLA|nr:unnamed protein product [Dibothriocephalus latus]
MYALAWRKQNDSTQQALTGPFLANVFMGKIKKTSLRGTINGLAFYGRYVDDIFCLTDYNADNDALVAKFKNTPTQKKKRSLQQELYCPDVSNSVGNP